ILYLSDLPFFPYPPLFRSVLGLREFFHAAGNNLGLLTGEVDTLFVDVLFVTDELEEKRHVDGGAFGADALDPGMLGSSASAPNRSEEHTLNSSHVAISYAV